jgi:amidase
MKDDGDIFFRSAAEIAAMIGGGKVRSLELVESLLRRIERYDAALNAMVVRDFERARETAAAIDRMPGSRGPLAGVPISVKESFDVAGLPTTWGLPAFRNDAASEDAAVVAALKEAGAVIMGKTNVPVLLGDFQSYNPVYGVTNNPWDPARTPGGSSGGAAAAVAAGFSYLEYGSDIGGSLRIPAHFCGVYAHKPTFGIVSTDGHSAPGSRGARSDLSVVGPIARFPKDLALALDITAGPDSLRTTGWRLSLPRDDREDPAAWRVALWPQDAMCPVDDEISARLIEVGTLLRRLGAFVSENARPNFASARHHEVYMLMLRAITTARQPDSILEESRAVLDSVAPDERNQRIYAARGATLLHREWLALNGERAAFRRAWKEFFSRYDVLLAPVAATTAFPHDHEPDRDLRRVMVNGQPQPYASQLFWSGLPVLSYLPATCAPMGLSKSGLPMGLQIIGPEYNDHRTIAFAELLRRVIGGFVPPPKLQQPQ